MENKWKLGEDMFPEDNILDGITFDEIILTLHCNVRKEQINADAVSKTAKEILEMRLEDCRFILENNIEEIVNRAKNYDVN